MDIVKPTPEWVDARSDQCGVGNKNVVKPNTISILNTFLLLPIVEFSETVDLVCDPAKIYGYLNIFYNKIFQVNKSAQI